MNERIRELVKQAGGHFSTHTLTSNPVQYRESIGLWDKNIEKFAELIVKECCDVLQTETISHDGYGYNQGFLHQKIKEYFGVEE